jgi:hypothetical protein
MSTEPDLDGRLRAGLAGAADAVDPPVGDLLAQATARGRRHRSRRRAAVLAVMLAIAAVPLGVVGVAHRFAATGVSTAAPSRAALLGTWQTPPLPASDWLATYRRAGGSDAAARAFLGPPMAGPATTYRIVLRVTAVDWALFVSADGGDLEAGWHGGYRLDGSVVQVREAAGRCEAAYDVRLSGASLKISVVSDDCGDTDGLAQRTIYQTSEFQRSPD